jgi:hypothetical protein
MPTALARLNWSPASGAAGVISVDEARVLLAIVKSILTWRLDVILQRSQRPKSSYKSFLSQGAQVFVFTGRRGLRLKSPLHEAQVSLQPMGV